MDSGDSEVKVRREKRERVMEACWKGMCTYSRTYYHQPYQ